MTTVLRLILPWTIALAGLPGAALAQAAAVQRCVVVSEAGDSQRWSGSAADCATRLSPASTYKIPHALIGLETGAVTDTKTGATTTESGESVSWLVGQLTVDQRKLIFASAVWRASGGVDTLDATRLAITTFVEHAVLQRTLKEDGAGFET